MNKTSKKNSQSTKLHLCSCWPVSRLHVVDRYFTLLTFRSFSLFVNWNRVGMLFGETETPISSLFSLRSKSSKKNGLSSLALWSAQNTLPNAQWVPNEHVLISGNLPASFVVFVFPNHFCDKRVWDELNAFLLVSDIATTEDNTIS